MDTAADLSRVILIIPSLNPTDALERMVKASAEVGFRRFLVIDDGSGPSFRPVFDRVEKIEGCTVLHHEVNRGKGAALKTAFAYCLSDLSGYAGAVTADGDGQHTPQDTAECARKMLAENALIFGCRDFSGPEVPGRSRFGNRLTSTVFRLFCGIRLSDTQTGLRAFPMHTLPTFLKTSGDRYEYETRMLTDMKDAKIPYAEQPIETIYDDGNAGSHFRPVRDSVRIYWQVLRYLLTGQPARFLFSSVLSAILEWVVNFILLTVFINTALPEVYHIFLAGGISMILSSICNQIVNRYVVFHSRGGGMRSVVRYYCLWAPQTALTLLLTKGLSLLFDASLPIVNTMLLVLSRMILFLLSYQIQKRWVFVDNDQKQK